LPLEDKFFFASDGRCSCHGASEENSVLVPLVVVRGVGVMR
jgi:hypothetical protein